MLKFAAANIWHTPGFFLFYFLWQRAFILLGDVFQIPMPRVRYLIALAIVSVGITLLPVVRRLISRFIHEYIKPIFLIFNGVSKAVVIVLSVFIGLCVAFPGYGVENSLLSGFLAAAGAIVAVFLFFTCTAAKLRRLGVHILGAAKAFTDIRFIAAVLLLNAYAVVYLLAARQPFFWDNAGFWRMAADMAEMVSTDPLEMVRTVVSSVSTSDYHLLPAVIPACVMAVFNTGRMAFVLSIVNFYVVPFWAVLYAAVKGAAGRSARFSGFTGFLTGALGLFFVPYLAVVGFPDVGGVIFAFACAYLFFYGGDDGFLSGLLLCATMMFRRWFVFYVIAFMFLAIVYALPDKERRGKLLRMFFGFGAPMVLFFQGYVSGVLLRENFAEIYEAYSFAVSTDVKFILYYFGLIPILGAAAWSLYSFVASFRQKRSFGTKTEKGGFTAVFPICCSILIFILFVSVQSFGMQHLLLFSAPLGIVCVNISAAPRLKLPVLGLAALCFISVFIPREQPASIHGIKGYALLPSYTIYPQVREDADALIGLDAYVRGLDGPVAVLASSFTLNPDLLSLVEPSFDPLKPLRANDRIVHTGSVDRRDALPFVLEFADYIVVADPVQVHLDPGEQRIVTVPAGAMLADTPFSAAFQRLDIEFELQNDTGVFIFKRIRSNTPEEMEWLWDEIR